MNTFLWIIGSTFSITLIAWTGVFVLFVKEELLKKVVVFLVSLSAGALLGGAFFHLLPEAIEVMGLNINVFLWLLAGFIVFFLLEEFIHWHHCHRAPSEHSNKKPMTYLVLISDASHNFIDGLAIGGAFIAGWHLGLITWLAIAAHEIPQELGDFGVLIHGGWEKMQALIFNYFSALTVLLGGAAAYFVSEKVNVSFLIPFAAGSFIYISASDLIPEIKGRGCLLEKLAHFVSFLAGIGIILAIKIFLG